MLRAVGSAAHVPPLLGHLLQHVLLQLQGAPDVVAVETQAAPDAASPKQTVPKTKAPVEYYVIQSGDTLSKIAKQYYGNAMEYPRIFEANKEVIEDPDKIYPGQKIRIPLDTAGAA